MNAETTKAMTDEVTAENLYSPSSEGEVKTALSRCTEALALVPYMDVEESVAQESLREMIRIRCRMRTDSFPLDMVEIDVCTVWRAILVLGHSSMQSVQDVDDGFDFRFAILDSEGRYLTGLIEIRQQELGRLRRKRLTGRAAK